VISSHEVLRELQGQNDLVHKWAIEHKEAFIKPNEAELDLVRKILKDHKELIKNRNLLEGRPVADPFVIAQSKIAERVLVTNEISKVNAHSIPNICEEYGIGYMNLESFMKSEKWAF